MKMHTLNISVITLLMVIAGACSTTSKEDPKDLIVNTWKLQEFTPAARFPMPDSVRQEIIAKTVLTFTEDGKFSQTGISRSHSGTYSISADGKTITYYHDARNVPFTETVLELTSKRMKVVDQNGNRMVRTNSITQ